MIGSLKGKIILKTDKFVLIETNGVGYKVNIPIETISKNGKENTEVFFYIHTHIREDAFDLYGFLEYKDLEFFEMLINVSGIGPKSAMGILGITSIETLSKAICNRDISYLTKISGIGKKTAEKIIIELRDKVSKDIGGSSLQEELDTLEALKSLGYSHHESREVLKNIDPNLDTNKKIMEALKILGKK